MNEGDFSFQRVAPGSYELTAKNEGYLEELPGETQNANATWVRLTSDERVDNIKVSLIRSSRIEGHVRTETGPACGRGSRRVDPIGPDESRRAGEDC